MKSMKRSRKQGNGPLRLKFPVIEQAEINGDDADEESNGDIPLVLSNQIAEAGGEAMFVSGNLMSNFLNATGGSSYTSPALPLLGVAFQHVLPAELRDVTLPPPLSVDAISSLPPQPPLSPGSGFITVSAETQAEVPNFFTRSLLDASCNVIGQFSPSRRRGSAHIDFRMAASYYGTMAERVVGTLLDAGALLLPGVRLPSTHFIPDGVHVQFLELEDIAADPEGLSVHGELSDEIIYHRSQAEAGTSHVHFLHRHFY